MRYDEVIRLLREAKKLKEKYLLELAKLKAVLGGVDEAKEIIEEILSDDGCDICKEKKVKNFLRLIDEYEKSLGD